jgi:hypothetical protein
MTKFLSDEQYGQLQRRLAEVARRADQGTIPFASTMDRVQAIIEGRGFVGDLMHGLFATPAQQLEMVKILNGQRDWGFTEEDFIQLGQVPIWPDHSSLTVAILEVSLNTVQQTFDTAWDLAANKQSDKWRWEHLKSDTDHLRLLAGQNQRGLKWRVVDLGANQDRKPIDVRTPETSPAAAILWMAYYSPAWVQAMNGNDVPFVWITGYEACTPGAQSWQGVPALGWFADDRQVKLGATHYDDQLGKWAVPAYLE